MRNRFQQGICPVIAHASPSQLVIYHQFVFANRPVDGLRLVEGEGLGYFKPMLVSLGSERAACTPGLQARAVAAATPASALSSVMAMILLLAG